MKLMSIRRVPSSSFKWYELLYLRLFTNTKISASVRTHCAIVVRGEVEVNSMQSISWQWLL
jgi:hypothetical protein